MSFRLVIPCLFSVKGKNYTPMTLSSPSALELILVSQCCILEVLFISYFAEHLIQAQMCCQPTELEPAHLAVHNFGQLVISSLSAQISHYFALLY